MPEVVALSALAAWCLGCAFVHVANRSRVVDRVVMLVTYAFASGVMAWLFYTGRSGLGFIALLMLMLYAAAAARMALPRMWDS